MRYAQLVIGAAGHGKSTYCSVIAEHALSSNRVIEIVNLDPANEYTNYKPLVDIRDLITVEEVMDDIEISLGAHGAPIFCLEYLVENSDWLKEQLGDASDDMYILIDCPGQIELWTHEPVMKKIVKLLESWEFKMCSIYLLDAHFVTDASKFISGALNVTSAMLHFELPHLSILSKVDLLSGKDRKKLDMFLEPDKNFLLENLKKQGSQWFQKYYKLNAAFASIVSDFSLVQFHPLDINDIDNICGILYTIDLLLQCDEDEETNAVDINEPDANDDNQ